MADQLDIKVMRLRYAGVCACGTPLAAGVRAGYDRSRKQVICPNCLAVADAGAQPVAELVTPSPAEADVQVAPSADQPPTQARKNSLERTYERRKTRCEEAVKAQHPHIGRFLLAVTSEPASTRAFKTGADGERKAAERIFGTAGENALFLSNRRLGRDRRDGDIDLIAITPDGVMIIDVKHYPDANVEVRSSGGLFSPRRQQLFVRGRDKTSWVDGLYKQHDAVRLAMNSAPDLAEVPITPTLCFVDSGLSRWHASAIGVVRIFGSVELGKHLAKVTGPFDREARAAIHAVLERELPPA